MSPIVLEGTISSVGIDRDGDHIAEIEVGDSPCEAEEVSVHTLVLAPEQCQALGAHLYRRVRITVEVLS